MPEEIDKRVDAIVESCMEDGDKDKEECTSMAYAIINAEKEVTKETENK